MANIEDLRKQLEQLRIIDEAAYKAALENIKTQKELRAEYEQGNITLKDYNELIEENNKSLSQNSKEIKALQEDLHKQAEAIERNSRLYSNFNSIVDKTTGAFDALTGASTSNLTTMSGQIKAAAELGMKLQGLQVDLRRGTGFANRHTQAFDRLRNTYVDYGMTADELAVSLTSLSTKFSAFDAMTAANRDAITKTAAEYKTLGVEFDDFAALNERLRFSFGVMGENAGMAADEIKRIARETGRPLSSVVSDLNEIGPELARFGAQGIEVFEGLARRARSLGLGVKEAFDITELFDTFEGAANIAGRLNAQLGLQLNSVELMRASTEERLDILRSEFQLQGKSFETMGRRQRQMVAGILGVSIEETAKLLGDGMDIQAFRAQESTQEQLIKSQDKVAAAMQRLTEDLPIVKAMGGMTGVIDAQAKAISTLATNTETLANALTGVAGARGIVDTSAGILSGLGGVADIVSLFRSGPGGRPKGGPGRISRMAGGLKSFFMGKEGKPGIFGKTRELFGKGLGKASGLVSGIGKAGLKKIPFGIGALLSIPGIAKAAMSGNVSSALGMTGSALLSAVPVYGTAASLALDATMAAKDMGAFSSAGSAPAMASGVVPSSGGSSGGGSIVVKEMTLPVRMIMDGREMGTVVEKIMNVKLDPVRPN